MISEFIIRCLVTALLISGVPLGCGCIAAQVVALLQSVFQIQEQSLGYLVKLLTMAAALCLCFDYLSSLALELFVDSIRLIGVIGGGVEF